MQSTSNITSQRFERLPTCAQIEAGLEGRGWGIGGGTLGPGGASVVELLGRRLVPVPHREAHRRLPVIIGDRDIADPVQEHLDHFLVAGRRRPA